MTNILESQAQDFIQSGDIDQAIAIYQAFQPESARIYRIIGTLYAQRKGDYTLAISYYERALEMQDEQNEDMSEILTYLGFAYQNREEFELAINYHIRALHLRQSSKTSNPLLIATSLFGIANAHWGEGNLLDALTYAQQALALNESISPQSDANIASCLAILANIYHRFGDDIQALEYTKRALILSERSLTEDSLGMISVLNNMGTIQFSAGLYEDALVTFIRVLHICERTLPEDHPRRIAILENVRQIIGMQEEDFVYSFAHFWTSLLQIILV